MAARWLYRDLGAIFHDDGLRTIWDGGSASGITAGNLIVPMTLALAADVILTEDVHTIWFTGSCVPFETRQYSLEMIQKNHARPSDNAPLVKALESAFSKVSFPIGSTTELTLLRSEYRLVTNDSDKEPKVLNELGRLFVTAKLGGEEAIVKQLGDLEKVLLSLLEIKN
jgi:hypothetical protein